MKKILLASIAVWWIFSATDYNCLNQCVMSGYQYGYCKRICSY